MGCAISKEVKRPSKRTPWDVHQGLIIQVDRSIKTSGGGYVSAIFSANCGIVRNPGPVKALEKRESLPKPSGKGSYSQHKASMTPERTNKHLSEKSVGDTVLGIPHLSTDLQSRLHAAQKSTESTNENLNTVNILELMEGLAEAEVCENYEQWNTNREPLMPSTGVVDRQGFPPDKPTDDALTQRASSCKPKARRPRPKSFSSFKSIEDVDRVLSARKSKSPPPIKSASKAWSVNAHGKKSSEEDFQSDDTSLQNGTSLRDLNVNINRLTCETDSKAADTTASCFDGKLFQNTDNLQRALSFKYMFNDSSSKKLDFLNADLNPAASQIDDRNAGVHHRDDLVLATARLWGEGDGASAPFSPAVSLKDWLPCSSHPSNCPGHLKGGLESSILDVFQTFQTCSSEQGAHHSSDSMKSQRMYPQGVSSQSASMQYQEGTTNLSIVEDGVPVFDPEMLDSFENAMKNLSKEEWDAVRGMEDSPRNFLRLVKELKKSSSNSMRNQKAFSKDQLEPAEPLDMKLKRLSVEKKLAFMRQNSLEVKKALAKASIKSDLERARVIFYSSTTQTNAKMYEDCNQVRNILQSLVGVSYDERSISELLKHEQELSYALNVSAVIVPTIYVKGKYLVGVDSIMQLYKKGLLGSMLQEAVLFGSKTGMQCICRGGKFLICPFCKGRRKISSVGEQTLLCRYCSGAGLIKCLSCSPT